MKTTALLASASAIFASSLLLSSLLVSSVNAQSKPPANVPPPPGMNDPGVKSVAPATPAVQTPAAQPALSPLKLPSMKDGDSRLGRPNASVPDVTVRQNGDNQVQEYRRNGQVYMVVVTPKNGLARTYMVDPQGRMIDEHGQRRANPAMYKVLEWGKAPPPAEKAPDAAAGDSGN